MAHMFLSRDLDEDSDMEYDVLAANTPCLRRQVGAILVTADGELSPTGRDFAFECRLRNIRDAISLPEQYRIIIDRDHLDTPDGEVKGRFYYQIEAQRIDTFTRQMGTGRGGKAYLDSHSTDSELIQTLFGLYKAYVEHEARETFLYNGRRIYGPHMDLNAVWEVAERYDASDPRK